MQIFHYIVIKCVTSICLLRLFLFVFEEHKLKRTFKSAIISMTRKTVWEYDNWSLFGMYLRLFSFRFFSLEVHKEFYFSEHRREVLLYKLLCAAVCADVHPSVQLMEFLSDNNEAAAADVLEFVREAIQRFDNLRPLIVEKMLEVFHAIKSVK